MGSNGSSAADIVWEFPSRGASKLRPTLGFNSIQQPDSHLHFWVKRWYLQETNFSVMLNSLGDLWQTPLRTRRNNEKPKRGHISPGSSRFSTEKEYFRLDFATPPSDIAWVLLGKLVRSSSRSRTPPAMESNADEELHSFSPSRPRVGSRARRQDWRENFRSVACFAIDFFSFSGASLHVFAVKFEAFFPWQISTHIFACESSKQKKPQSWPSKPVDLQDSFELDLEFTLRSCSSTEWREFWKSMRWGCGSRRGELLSDANVAGTKEWLSYKLETRWLVVGFQRKFFVLVLSLLASSPKKK